MNPKALVDIGEVLLFAVERIAEWVDEVGGDPLDDTDALKALDRLKQRSDAAGARIRQAADRRRVGS